MVEKIVGGLILAFLTYVGRTLWQNRRHLKLLQVLLAPKCRTRVSVAVLLRVHEESQLVLFATPARPGAFGPPGGVVKYRETARLDLERLGFEPEHRDRDVMRLDLRGFISGSNVLAFARWLHREDGRETATECLRRELIEELGEIGHEELVSLAEVVAFRHVRRVIDGPMKVPGETYRQLRFLDVYDLLADRREAEELRSILVSLANEPAEARVIGASPREIALGRAGTHMVLPQSAFLVSDRRYREDLHPAS
ncbi:SMODS-associated NUDIX domain-containing protein [Streptomyces althioticus]|uniref:SMODS-associated NUDIX domain-containing protein n=1 Tax=Streptomyces althioticus TaxID=83380 RepID=UPI003700702B